MSRVRPAVEAMASLRVTPFALLALAIGVLASYRDPSAPGWWMTLPLALLALNLGAALLVDARLRLRAPLLVFHVALLTVLLLAVAGELLRFSGRVELVEGTRLDRGAVLADARGVLHRDAWLDALQVEQGPFSVEYQPGMVPGRTRSELRVLDDDGRRAAFEIGNTQPLLEHGYRLHTTSNKGFAALLEWRDVDGLRVSGALHFPSFPLADWRQLNQWTAPGGAVFEFELLPALRVPGDRAYTLDSRTASDGAVVLVRDDAGHTLARLAPGQSASLPGGVLRLTGVRMWMGYRVSFDPLLPWLLACGLVGAAALGAHFWRRLAPSTSNAPAGSFTGDAGARA